MYLKNLELHPRETTTILHLIADAFNFLKRSKVNNTIVF